MPATFGVGNLEITPPSGTHVQEVTDDATIEIATVRSKEGVTVRMEPIPMTERTYTVKCKGGAALSLVTAGEFESNTLKCISVKNTEPNTDFCDCELTYKSYT